MSRNTLVLSAAIAAAGTVLLGACGAGTGNEGGATPVAVRQQAQVETSTPAKSTSATVTITVADVDELGKVLTTGDGRTLYRYGEDLAEPPMSNCQGDCATAWPPLLAKGKVAVEGLSREILGTVDRPDGTKQVTVKGWPVYTYAKDTGPGDASGQGADDAKWTTISPTGATVTEGLGAAIDTTRIGGLGTVLTDGDGRTLYLFKEDSKEPPESTCEGECAEAWPPLIADGGVDIEGVDPSLVGTVERADGTKQVTVGGWPVYTYAKDAAPGDATGHGVKGTWYAVEPKGCAVSPDKKPAGSGSGESSGDGSDY